ncbi:MAG: dihydrolipoyl dehydrogenase [Myxococcales bacterium]|nr:dihydrolipoyl dehydrogenase [Myxococcales bacterium]
MKQLSLNVDVAVIGAGTAGLAAYRAATSEGARSVLIEGGPYGTTCARVGCMPSKLLIAAAEAAHHATHAEPFGVSVTEVEIDGRKVMKRVRDERDRFVGFVVRDTLALPDTDRLRGYARFEDQRTLVVTDAETRTETLVHARAVVIATGSTPVVLPMFDGLGDRVIVNDDIFDWEDLPESAAVFGPGVIGLELGQALSRLGVRVRMFGVGGLIGPLTDPKIREEATKIMGREFPLDTDAKVHSLKRVGDQVEIDFQWDGERLQERFDYVLTATGRRPNLDRLALERTGVAVDGRGVPVYDPRTLQVLDSRLFLAGDVNNVRPLLHEASDEGRIAGTNAARFPNCTYSALSDLKPNAPLQRRSHITVVFSDPQIAMVGSSWKELEALRDEGRVVVGEVSFEDQGRSRVMRVNQGLLRLYADAGDGRLLGAEMIGPRAEHLAHLLSWAHQQKQSVIELLCMPFYHPVIEEGVRTALRDAAKQLEARGGLQRRCA